MINSQKSDPKILSTVTENFESWQGGISNGYYEPKTRTIHVLNQEDLQKKILWHEQAHDLRRNKVTFRLASVTQTPLFLSLLLGLFFVFAAYSLASVFVMPEGLLLHSIPLLFVSCLIVFFNQCTVYEERQADKSVLKELARYKEQ